MPGPKETRAVVGMRCPEPIFPVRDLEAAMAFYARLGFAVRRYDAGYGLISDSVQDKPWRVREFSIRDLDNNQLRFGRPSG